MPKARIFGRQEMIFANGVVVHLALPPRATGRHGQRFVICLLAFGAARRKTSSQAALNGGRVDLYNVPKPIFADGVVLVTQAVSEGSYFLPGLTRHKGRGQISQFSCCFASRRRAGLSEGTRAVPVNLGLKTILPHRLFDDIHLAAQNSGQAPFEVAQAAEIIETWR